MTSSHDPREIVCRHCHTVGNVRAERIRVRMKESRRSKTIRAIVTDGWSLLFSRRREATQYTCRACGMTWLR